ncbi:phytoene desaturase [Bryobacterales bacterium F-183]|nr:phytoene desaturase [Bryobacterales bacterium F-183]
MAKSQAKNFYYSFVLLDETRKQSMCAVYAFMRYCDDLSDDEGIANRKEALQNWQCDLTAALEGKTVPDHPLWPAFLDTVSRYQIPHEYFYEMIEGVSSDVEPRQIETFEELYRYCYQVASVVGMTVIHIFGFEDPRALGLAEKCGIAFQLTNIMRDIKEDAAMGRRYIPAEELQRFRVDKFEYTPEFFVFMRFQGQRAQLYYDESRELLELVNPKCRASLWALIEIYRRLLHKINSSGYRVLDGRIRLTTMQKLTVVAQAFMRR